MRDLFDRDFPGNNQLTADYLMKSGPKVAYQPKTPDDEGRRKHFEDEQKRLDEIRDLTDELVEKVGDISDVLIPLMDRDSAHIDRVMDRKAEMEKPKPDVADKRPTLADLSSGLSIPDYGGILTDQGITMTRFGADISRFTAAALHKGSLYTHDIYMFQQQMRTNALLLEMVKLLAEGKDISGKRFDDSFIDASTGTIHPNVVSLKELENRIGGTISTYQSAMSLNHPNPLHAVTKDMTKGVVDEANKAAIDSVAKAIDGQVEHGEAGGHRKGHGPTHGRSGETKETIRDLALLHGQFAGTLDHMMWKFKHMRGRAVADMVKALSGGLVGISAFKPMAIDIAEAVKYQQEIRKVAFQTEAISHGLKAQQKQFMARNQLMKIATATGQKLAEVEKSYVKNLQSGYRTQKETLKVTRAGMSAATMLGTGAEETASQFHQMYMSLALSADQMAEIGRGIQQSARFSRMTGENMLKAVEASKPFLDNMKRAGTLTAGAGSNIIGLTAEFQKLGISEKMSPVMNAMTSLADWLNADEKARMATGVLTGGGFNRFMGGKVFTDKKLQAEMAANADNYLRQFGFDSKTVNNASIAEREQANAALQMTMGMGLMDLVQTAEVFRRKSQTLVQNLAEIDTKIKTTGKYDVGQRNALITQKEDLRQEVRMGIMTQISELMAKRPGRSLSKTLEATGGEDLVPLQEQLREIYDADKFRFNRAGVTERNLASTTGMERVLGVTYKEAIERTNKQLSTNNFRSDDQYIIRDVDRTLKDAMSDPTGEKMTILLDRLNQGQQAAQTAAQASTDPLLSALLTLNDWNAKIATGVGEAVTQLTDIAGKTGIIALAMGAMSADALVAFGGLFKGIARKAFSGRMQATAGHMMAAGLSPAWGEGRIAASIASTPGVVLQTGGYVKDKIVQAGSIAKGEVSALIGGVLPRGAAPYEAARGTARGFGGGVKSFARNAFRVPLDMGGFLVNNKATRAASRLVPSPIRNAFASVFDPTTSPIGKFFGKTLPGLIKSAFDPKMMKQRIMTGFDWAIGKEGPLKKLRDSFATDTGAGSLFVKEVASYFAPDTKVGKAIGAVKSKAGLLGGKAKEFGNTLVQTSLAQGIIGKAKNIKGALGGAGESMGRFATGKMGVGESVFRLARAQEKIPIWGKFASMFGAGAEIAAQPGMAWAGGLGSASAVGAAGAAASTQTIASVASKAALPLLAFTTAMFSMSQGLESATRAEDLFALETQDVTMAHRKSAESAGFLTGILNTLSFGIFDHWIGAAGTLTSQLAIFLKDWPLLTAAIQAVMLPVKVVYGLLTGLWEFVKEVFKGIWDGVVEILKPIQEAFVEIQNAMEPVWAALSDAFKPIAEALKPFLGEIGGGASIIGTLTFALKKLGVAVGWVFRGLGMLIGFVMRTIVPVISVIAKIVAAGLTTIIDVVKPFISGIADMVRGVFDFVDGLITLIKGIVSLDGDVIYVALGKLFNGVANLFQGIGKFVIASFVGLYTAIPRLMWNVMGAVASAMYTWGKGLGKLVIRSFITWHYTIPRMILGLLSTITSGLLRWGKSLGKQFIKVIGHIGSIIAAPFRWVGGILENFGSNFAGIGEFFNRLLSGNWGGAFKMLKDGLVSTFLSGISAIGQAILSIPTQLFTFITGMFGRLDRWAEANVPFYKAGKGAFGAAAGAMGMGAFGAAAGHVGVGDMWNWVRGLLGFAEGGVVTSPGLAMVGEAGPELVIPIDRMQQMIAGGKDTGLKMSPAIVAQGNSSSEVRTMQRTDRLTEKVTASVGSMTETLATNVIDPFQSLGDTFAFADTSVVGFGKFVGQLTKNNMSDFWDRFKKGFGTTTDEAGQSLAISLLTTVDRATMSMATVVKDAAMAPAQVIKNIVVAPVRAGATAGNHLARNVNAAYEQGGVRQAALATMGNVILGAKELASTVKKKALDFGHWVAGFVPHATNGVVAPIPTPGIMPARKPPVPGVSAVGTPDEHARRLERIRRGIVSTGGGGPNKKEHIPIGLLHPRLSPRDLMKFSKGEEVMDTEPLPKRYSPGWGEKMVRGSLVVAYDPEMFPVTPTTISPPVPPAVAGIKKFQDQMKSAWEPKVFLPEPEDRPELHGRSLPDIEPQAIMIPLRPDELPQSTMTPKEVHDRIRDKSFPSGLDVFAKEPALENRRQTLDMAIPKGFDVLRKGPAMEVPTPLNGVREQGLRRNVFEPNLSLIRPGGVSQIEPADIRTNLLPIDAGRMPAMEVPTPLNDVREQGLRRNVFEPNLPLIRPGRMSQIEPAGIRTNLLPAMEVPTPLNDVREQELRRNVFEPNLPLIRPGGVSQIEPAGIRTNLLPIDAGRMVGETASPMPISRHLGVNLIPGYAGMLDESGEVRATEAKARMEPLPLQDIHERIHQEIVASQPESSEVSSPELVAMSRDTEQMVDYLSDVAAGINKLLEYLKPTNSASGDPRSRAASTRSRIQPHNSPQYYNLSFGNFTDGAIKGVVNDGST